MNVGQFNASIENARRLLKREKLLRQESPKAGNISDKFKAACKLLDYSAIYRTAVDELDYSFLLRDESFFQFSRYQSEEKISLRYAFYECPFEFPTFDEYLSNAGLESSYRDVEIRSGYEQELTEAPAKASFCPMRFDYSEDQYTPGMHPTSHLHIGHANSVRIPIFRVLTPLAFVVTVLKQVYFGAWPKLAIARETEKQRKQRKENCPIVPPRFFGPLDKSDFYLH